MLKKSGRKRGRNVGGHVCCLLLLGTLAACTVEDPLKMGPEDFPPSLAGNVTNSVTGAGIVGATVSAQGKSAVTGGNGFYILGDFKAGTYAVKVTHTDYVDTERTVDIKGFLQTSNFQLNPK